MDREPREPFPIEPTRQKPQEFIQKDEDTGVFRLPTGMAQQLFDLPDEDRAQARLRLLSFLQSSRAKVLKELDPVNAASTAMIQEAVDLVCMGETDEAWLFHGPIGSPVEHLSLAKDIVPHRVAWVRVLLDIHVEKQGDTPGPA